MYAIRSYYALIAEEQAAGGKPRDIARRVKERTSGWTVGDVYQLMQQRPE